MAYLRGDNYVWAGTDGRFHVWLADGDDGWSESVWACADDGTRAKGREESSGVGMPSDAMDEFVVMRLAELIRDGTVAATIDRAIQNHEGNFGCSALVERAEQLKEDLKGAR
jgi:hypothetical protein